MEQRPDLTFYFSLHAAQRAATDRYLAAVTALDEQDRTTRGRALGRWTKGFIAELDEHHHVEDTFFFPSLRAAVPAAAATLDGLDADHRRLDLLLARWTCVARALADPRQPFDPAKAQAVELAAELREFLQAHLAIEDADVLPLFWRHYTPAAYDQVVQQAMRNGKKAGLWFVAPFSVDCYPEGPERDAFLASAPLPLRLLHRLVRPRYDRLVAAAFGGRDARSSVAP
ncbi:MAG: hemerythrin domain-containing protein [Actinomycetota bacterium]|nr:hemerythrin domain-containing protein [Actinomycetota bacterium]